ncbi:MAG TPA: MFS transporter [Planctomycetota bacterium]|nr:MFS transporter [Planctomycetota bacterium]
MSGISREKVLATACALGASGALAGLIVLGSRNLEHFDAALVGYTFAVLFAAFGVAYRYSMWLQRPPTWLYFKRGWQVFLAPSFLKTNLRELGRRFAVEFVANRFILARGRLRWAAHWLIMWGCIIAGAITFPLVFGWLHFTTTPGDLGWYRVHVFGFPTIAFPHDGFVGFFFFHGLVWASFLVIAGVMLAFRRRMVDHGAAAAQQFGEDILPLVLLFAISVTGLMLTASYTWMKGYAFDFIAILHAVTVIVTLLYLPFGKFFHIAQRPAQLGVAFYKDAGKRSEQALCRRCGKPYASAMMVSDLIEVERRLGFRYKMPPGPGTARAEHYQQVCPRCRRALFGLAQAALIAGPEAHGDAPR